MALLSLLQDTARIKESRAALVQARRTVVARSRSESRLTIADQRGNRRIDDPRDFIRLEIETAIAHGVRIIPVLVLHGQDKRDGDGKVAGGRPVRRWSPRPLLRPWCRCPLAAAVAAHTWWVGDRRLTLRPRQPACRMSGLEAAEPASRSDNRQPRAAIVQYATGYCKNLMRSLGKRPGWAVSASHPLELFPAFVICVIASSVLDTWIYNNIRGSLLIVVLFHATTNLPSRSTDALVSGAMPHF